MGTATGTRWLSFRAYAEAPLAQAQAPVARVREAVLERPFVALGIALALGVVAGTLAARALRRDD